MTEQKHFNYEGNIDLRTLHKPDVQIKVEGVEFLTPARLKLTYDGKGTSVMVNIDIINRKVYDQSGSTVLTDLVFAHLDETTTLPEDFFAAPEEITDIAAKAEQERVQQTEEFVGGEKYG